MASPFRVSIADGQRTLFLRPSARLGAPFDSAGPDRVGGEPRFLLALSPLRNAGGDPPGLHPDRAGQRIVGAAGDFKTCLAICDEFGGDPPRIGASVVDRRERDHRNDLRDSRNGAAFISGRSGAGLSGDHGADDVRGGADPRRQPARRPRVCLDQSEGPDLMKPIEVVTLENRAIPSSYPVSIWRRLRKLRVALLGGLIVALVFGVALSAPLLAPHDPDRIENKKNHQPPDTHQPNNTKPLGRD